MDSSGKDLEKGTATATATPPGSLCSESDNDDGIDNHVPYPQKQHQAKAKISSQKRAVCCAAFALLLAVTIFAVALASSLKKPRQLPLSPHQMISNEHLNNRDVDVGMIDVPDGGGWQQQQPPREQPLEGVQQGKQLEIDMKAKELLEQSPKKEVSSVEKVQEQPVEDVTYHDNFNGMNINNEDHITTEATENQAAEKVPTANNHQMTTTTLNPEDCDNPNCIQHSNSNNSPSSIVVGDHNEEDAYLPIFQGPMSDFIVVASNTTLLVDFTNPQNSSNSKRCYKPNEGIAQLTLDTDRYSWETSWSIKRLPNGKSFAYGPPSGNKYVRSTRYIGAVCLPAGDYNLVMRDRVGDGLCCTHGSGKVSVVVNGEKMVESGSEDYTVKRYGFSVTRE